jgi:glutamyl-tRNA synthetase
VNGICKINDKIQGLVEVKYEEIDDYIILRSDGSPTFLLSSAVDDFNMKVTDIIRGDDHLTNSFRQKVIFDFLEYKPNFAHISLIHNENNQKLSKRDNAASILEYKSSGYLSQAINNYLMRLGWSLGDKEIFTLEEIQEKFTLENIGKSPSKHDMKKLDFLNNHYLKITDNETLLNSLRERYDFSSFDEKFKKKIFT